MHKTRNFLFHLYMAMFLFYLLAPLVVMGGAAFNDSRFPSILPWKGFTLDWFSQLAADGRMWLAFRNTVIVALANKILHNDIGCSYHPNSWGERFHWYSSTGWVMWNAQLGGLAGGTTICLFDGSPGGSKDAPDWTVLWRFAARHRVTFFGAGAAFFARAAFGFLVPPLAARSVRSATAWSRSRAASPIGAISGR